MWGKEVKIFFCILILLSVLIFLYYIYFLMFFFFSFFIINVELGVDVSRVRLFGVGV